VHSWFANGEAYKSILYVVKDRRQGVFLWHPIFPPEQIFV